MANPQPCKVCETEGVHSLSNWLITAQDPNPEFPPGTTFYVCQPCLAGLMIAWVQSQQAEPTFVDPDAPPDETPPEGPGVLEQVEADEGKVTPAPNGTGKKSKAPPAGAPEVVEGSGQTATADVNS